MRSPPLDIQGIQLINVDNRQEPTHDTLSYECDYRNKGVYFLKEHNSVLIGRAPQALRSSGFQRSSGQGNRTVPPNSWVHPSPVLSRSHAVITLSKDKVRTQPYCGE